MPALKYWNGSAWVPLYTQGAAPAGAAPPAIRGQPGTILQAGTAGIPDLNTSGAGALYDIATYLDGATYAMATTTYVVAGFWCGYGGSDVVFSTDIWAFGPNALAAASPNPIHCHAGYWTAAPVVAAWAVNPGVNIGFKLRATFNSGSNFHTAGGVNYIVMAN